MITITKARIFIQIIAFGIFLFQMQNAITKYVQKPIVQQTSTTSFQNIEKPVIYICQDGQFSYKKAEEFGYKSQTDVIFGLLGYPDMTNITC